MTGPPATRPDFQAAPPSKRANPDGIPVRLHDGTLIADIDQELADEMVIAGDAQAFRRGPRRYLRLRQGISIPRTARGWNITELLRRWHGDYAPSEVAELWHLNVETIRRMFQDEPGVVVIQGPPKKGKRPYKTIRIPKSVLERVHRRLQR